MSKVGEDDWGQLYISSLMLIWLDLVCSHSDAWATVWQA
jgi:hypothetical protein